MAKKFIEIQDMKLPLYEYNTLVIGSGAASLNAADSLYKLGQKDIVLITEGMNKGTSRNTGSDKQTYYKQSTSLEDLDSPLKMAETLFSGGAMHGDIALVEGALSLKSFYKLIEIGVPFPHDSYGQYVGYKTDHDANSRASSVGPLTSKQMTEELEDEVRKNGTEIHDNTTIISLLTDEDGSRVVGALGIDSTRTDDNFGLVVYNASNIIYGTGGPASMYNRSVFPGSQSGATGIALEAGAKAHNLTEWQYGIASTKFRWNLSGTYQQVIPRYISTDENMEDEREFLEDYFENPTDLLNAVFLKGYQWPFDATKLPNNGSSMIDLLVYVETQIKGRKVFMDFMENPKCANKEDGSFNFDLLGEEAYGYLKNSSAFQDKPIERLDHMNPLAIDLYDDNNIDIRSEYLEIDVCAQHQNGGLAGNIWWESNIKHLFPVGEVNGTLGIYRPGGSALNSTQVGSYRAAEYIASQYVDRPKNIDDFKKDVADQIEKRLGFIKSIKVKNKTNLFDYQLELQKDMSKIGAFIRDKKDIADHIDKFKEKLKNLENDLYIESENQLNKVFKIYDMLISQITSLSSFKEYIDRGGDSRGSYLVVDEDGKEHISIDDIDFKFSLENDIRDKVCESVFDIAREDVEHKWVDVRPIPRYDSWFENVWDDFRNEKIFK